MLVQNSWLLDTPHPAAHMQSPTRKDLCGEHLLVVCIKPAIEHVLIWQIRDPEMQQTH